MTLTAGLINLESLDLSLAALRRWITPCFAARSRVLNAFAISEPVFLAFLTTLL